MIGFAGESAEPRHVVLVHEAGRRWIDALRGHADGMPIQVRHSTSVQDSLGIARSEPLSAMVVELGQRPLESLQLLETIGCYHSSVVLIVLASSKQRDLALPARELGATAVLHEPLTGTEMACTVVSILRSLFTLTG
jgi:DNA-binding response OmpR family regulator